ncbi:NAD(P)/FAD-dependent oxidoreductase [Bdellovibrio bacteriovorus]
MKLIHPAKKEGKTIVVIIGAGFGGLNAAKELAKDSNIHVIIIDRRNHHLFQPLLYQVATAGLNVGDIAVSIRSQFSGQSNVEVHHGKIEFVDLKQSLIGLEKEDLNLEYDYLILACGAQHSYFGKQEWEQFAPGLKSLEHATEIRRRILSAFEHAENEFDEEKKKAFLTFVVVGGGPTGVELAGAIADISRTVLINDYRRIDPSQAHILLVEAGERLVGSFDPKLSEYTKEALTNLGVEVKTTARVEDITAEGVTITGKFIPAKSVFWCAGVQAAKINIKEEIEKDRAGRIKVLKDLTIPKYPNAFVIGDMAAVQWKDNQIVPGLAPAAIQQGIHAAKNIKSALLGKALKEFIYNDKGQMATIGKNKAILQFGHLKMTGHLAWLSWLFVHVWYLAGFKNKIFVFIQWMWSYLFRRRSTRIITEPNWKQSS